MIMYPVRYSFTFAQFRGFSIQFYRTGLGRNYGEPRKITPVWHSFALAMNELKCLQSKPKGSPAASLRMAAEIHSAQFEKPGLNRSGKCRTRFERCSYRLTVMDRSTALSFFKA